MALDQAGTGEQTLGVIGGRVGGDVALDGGDAAALDADVERLTGAVVQPRIADDEVHVDLMGGNAA